MKLTKNRLKQIIKEELEDLDEQSPYVVDRMSSTEYANKFIGEPLFGQVMKKMEEIAGAGRPSQKTGFEFLVALDIVLEEREKQSKDKQ